MRDLTGQGEAEANYSAMCLLMPEEFVRRDLNDLGPICWDHPHLKNLIDKYKVEFSLFFIRLGQLGYMKGHGIQP
jgi:Zn-dependent peptidase ImmA (M78 family)